MGKLRSAWRGRGPGLGILPPVPGASLSFPAVIEVGAGMLLGVLGAPKGVRVVGVSLTLSVTGWVARHWSPVTWLQRPYVFSGLLMGGCEGQGVSGAGGSSRLCFPFCSSLTAASSSG